MVFVLFRTKKMWNMTGDSALICSVDCLTHTSPHVGASLGLPASPIPPPPPSSRFHPTPRYPHCSSTLPNVVLSLASAVRRRRWAPPASPLKDNVVYCICQVNAAILCKSIGHLLPCTLSSYWWATFVRFCLCYSRLKVGNTPLRIVMPVML